MINIKDIKINDIVSFWVFMGISMQGSGNFSNNGMVYGKVIKIGSKKIKVRIENGDIGWIYANKWDLEFENDPELVAEILKNTQEA